MTTPHSMEITLSSALFNKLGQSIESLIGLHFPPARLDDLYRGISAAAHDFGFDDVNRCVEWLLSSTLSKNQIETLAGNLTIGETYFFRDKRVFEILETDIIPEILKVKRGPEQRLRIWSAGCASGEEPYSLAILLTGMLADRDDWDISILATDISPLCLKKAVQGVYGEWSFRETPKWVKNRWFECRDRSCTIAPRIRQMVSFCTLNLAEDCYPAIINQTNAMDIIFCRNVLMYFSRERAITIIENLARCLVNGGWLVISPIDVPGSRLSPLLCPVSFPGAMFYRREKKQGSVLPSLSSLPRKKPVIPPTKQKKTRSDMVGLVTDRKRLKKDLPALPDTPPPDTSKMTGQVRLLANQGKLGDALALSETAIKSDKLNSALHYLKATILQEMNRPDDAEAALKRALYIDQDFALAHFSMGHLLQRRGKEKEAGKHLDKARTLLKSYGQNDILPEGEGMSTGRLIELINRMKG